VSICCRQRKRLLTGTPTSVGTSTITVTAANSAGQSVSASFDIDIQNNTPPTIISGTSSSIDENAPTNITAYSVVATDVDGDTLTYSLSGTDAAAFSINSSSGIVTLVSSADYETQASYSINVIATDPGTFTATQAVTINVTDLIYESGALFIAGDGSGGGGGATSTSGVGTAGGAGGGDADIIVGSAGNDVIFGDGSGGGGGGLHSGTAATALENGGVGGGGADTIYGGAGNDILFGDGFDGSLGNFSNEAAGPGGDGGLGGGGGGGGGSGVNGSGPAYDGHNGGNGGIAAGGGGGGTPYPSNTYLAGSGGAGGVGGGGAGSAGVTSNPMTGGDGGSAVQGGSFGVGAIGGTTSSGGGGSGGSGLNAAGGGAGGQGSGSTSGAATSPGAGDTSVVTVDDSGATISTYVSGQLSTIFTSTIGTLNGYGAGADILDGGVGSDHMFGLGGNDIFVFELNDAGATDIDTVWDFNKNAETDKIKLTQNGEVIDATTQTALISAQTISGSDRSIVFSDSNAGTQVTIQVVGIGRDLTTADLCVTGASDPLVLDLNGNGVELSSKNDSPVMFDVNADGIQDQTGWISGGDGLLVMDVNANGRIDDMREVISEYFTPDVQTSLAALATLDLNHDGKIDANDAAFNQLQVWVDQNHDAVSTSQELYTLSELDITELGLDLDDTGPIAKSDNTINGYADVTYTDGRQGTMGEVQFSYDTTDTNKVVDLFSGNSEDILIWQDVDSEGKSLTEELYSFDQVGSQQFEGTVWLEDVGQVLSYSTFDWSDGAFGDYLEVELLVGEEDDIAVDETANQVSQAIQDIQYINFAAESFSDLQLAVDDGTIEAILDIEQDSADFALVDFIDSDGGEDSGLFLLYDHADSGMSIVAGSLTDEIFTANDIDSPIY
jgi:hypothetical protein